MNTALIEAIKEGLRIVVISIIPILIDGFTRGEIDIRLVGITAAITALRALDKWLHETGKETGNESLEKGLTRF